MRAICVGHLAFDTTLPVLDFPIENTKIRIDKDIIHCGGGPASNAAYLLGSWKMPTTIIGAVGDDILGDYLISEFEEIGVDTSLIEKIKGKKTTTSYIIANINKGSRTIFTKKEDGLNVTDNFLMLKDDDKKSEVEVILIDGEEYKASVDILSKYPQAISIIDAGRVRDSTVSLCKLVDYVVCSKDFALEYTNHSVVNDTTLIEMYQKLKQDFNQAQVIITLEEMGCYTEIDGVLQIIPSILVKPVDSTGAGDIFHGAFAYFIANQYPLKEALILSNITGALSTLQIGGRNSIPLFHEVLEKRKNYDILK